jgi:hypothetical protein
MPPPLSGDTRVNQVLDAIPGALDYIVSLDPHDFQRLRHPALRRYMGPRISLLRRVAAIAGVPEGSLDRVRQDLRAALAPRFMLTEGETPRGARTLRITAPAADGA